MRAELITKHEPKPDRAIRNLKKKKRKKMVFMRTSERPSDFNPINFRYFHITREVLLKFNGYFPDYFSAFSRTLLGFFGQPLSKQLYMQHNAGLTCVWERKKKKTHEDCSRDFILVSGKQIRKLRVTLQSMINGSSQSTQAIVHRLVWLVTYLEITWTEFWLRSNKNLCDQSVETYT